MITTSRFLGYDKNEYGDLIVNRKEPLSNECRLVKDWGAA